jgi:hypothetical protein
MGNIAHPTKQPKPRKPSTSSPPLSSAPPHAQGHRDVLLICAINRPAATIAAHTPHGRLIDKAGGDIPTTAILT